MAHEHHHNPFHHKEDVQPIPVTDTAGAYDPGVGAYGPGVGDLRADIKHDKHKEHLGELGAGGAAAYALHEKHAGKHEPEQAHGHKIKEELAGVAGLGAGGAAFHEHHNKKEAKEAEKEAEGKKHHHIF